jgi:hypothetical protein
MAFDPDSDDTALLRTVVQLVRVAALAAAARHDDGSAQLAAERVAQALLKLRRLERIRKTASSIRKGAEQIDGDADRIASQLGRLLAQAQRALESQEGLRGDPNPPRARRKPDLSYSTERIRCPCRWAGEGWTHDINDPPPVRPLLHHPAQRDAADCRTSGPRAPRRA